MLIIRKPQMDVFRKYMLGRFEDRMAEHLRSAFPSETGSIEEADLRATIREGVEKARSYDLVLKNDVRRYLEYMFIHGYDFDENPEIPWAGEILRNPEYDAVEKMDRLDRNDMVAAMGGR